MNTPEQHKRNVLLGGVAAALQAYSFLLKGLFTLGLDVFLCVYRLVPTISPMPN